MKAKLGKKNTQNKSQKENSGKIFRRFHNLTLQILQLQGGLFVYLFAFISTSATGTRSDT